MNKILKTLMFSDLFIISSFGLIQPIFAIYLLRHIDKATVATVGVAVTIQLFTKALLQVLVARWADEERGNCRELYTLLAGSIIISLVPLGYIWATTIGTMYFIQCLYGIGQALSFPSWKVIFTRYSNPEKTGYEWGLYDTVVSFGTATAASVGGILAEQASFTFLLIFVSAFSLIGTMFISYIFQQEFSCRISLPNLKRVLSNKKVS